MIALAQGRNACEQGRARIGAHWRSFCEQDEAVRVACPFHKQLLRWACFQGGQRGQHGLRARRQRCQLLPGLAHLHIPACEAQLMHNHIT